MLGDELTTIRPKREFKNLVSNKPRGMRAESAKKILIARESLRPSNRISVRTASKMAGGRCALRLQEQTDALDHVKGAVQHWMCSTPALCLLMS